MAKNVCQVLIKQKLIDCLCRQPKVKIRENIDNRTTYIYTELIIYRTDVRTLLKCNCEKLTAIEKNEC